MSPCVCTKGHEWVWMLAWRGKQSCRVRTQSAWSQSSSWRLEDKDWVREKSGKPPPLPVNTLTGNNPCFVCLWNLALIMQNSIRPSDRTVQVSPSNVLFVSNVTSHKHSKAATFFRKSFFITEKLVVFQVCAVEKFYQNELLLCFLSSFIKMENSLTDFCGIGFSNRNQNWFLKI